MLSKDAENQLVKLKYRMQFFWKESWFYREIAQPNFTYAGHVLRGSGGRNSLIILEGKMKDNKQKEDRRECGLTTSGHRQW